MPRRSERLPIPGAPVGTERHLTVHRYGAPGARPKAYIQGSLHADETAGMLTALHLVGLLDALDPPGGDGGAVAGEVVVVPAANPVGLAQVLAGIHHGRHALADGRNFNRGWPQLHDAVAARVADRLGDDADANVAAIRAAMGELLGERKARHEGEHLRLALARLGHDADLILDLHTDDEALVHLYQLPDHWPETEALAGDLGAAAVLLAADSGGGPFDEAWSTVFTRLAARFPDKPIPPACCAVTVELRGRGDVSDDLAARDAAALLNELRRRGIVRDTQPQAAPPACPATDLAATEVLHAPAGGLVAYRVRPGDRVTRGDIVAELVDPFAPDPAAARTPVAAGTDGLILSRRIQKYAQPGDALAKIVGTPPLPGRQAGALLED